MASSYSDVGEALRAFASQNSFAFVDYDDHGGWDIVFRRKLGGHVVFSVKSRGDQLSCDVRWFILESNGMMHSVGCRPELISRSSVKLKSLMNKFLDQVKSWTMRSMVNHTRTPGLPSVTTIKCDVLDI